MKADRSSIRRARQRTAFVAPVSRVRIFERDDWICQLCHKALDPSALVPDPLAPTLDHITPLANGGTHEPANVQAAHFLCNSTKSNREDWTHGRPNT
ncbi:HNH endonuclease [Streptomyces sp. NPDC001552]|uniref:HNH endonuclease n=1 Tax=Streptomyces sp. NPDC001552 TaxID=3364587 RepID=UPI0036AEF027